MPNGVAEVTTVCFVAATRNADIVSATDDPMTTGWAQIRRRIADGPAWL